jgi:hypothetical protein
MFLKWDILIIAVIAVTAILAVVFDFRPEGNTVEITLDGKVLYNLSLNEDRTVLIENVGKIIIENNTVRISEPTCPDKLCEKLGRISGAGQSIICLPNKLIIRVKGESEWDIIV